MPPKRSADADPASDRRAADIEGARPATAPALRQMQEASPGFFAQLDWAVRVPILAGAGAALILGDTVLGALAVSAGMMPGQDDECAEAWLTVLGP